MATYKVGADGKAQKGLKAGDKVVTAGGTFTISKVNSDGSYQSSKTSNTTTKNYTGSYASSPSSAASGAKSAVSSGSSKKSSGSSGSKVTATTGTGSYNTTNDFFNANADRISGIAKANNVDMNTAQDMFRSNIMNYSNGKEVYSGAGVGDMAALKRAYENAMRNDPASTRYSSGGGYSASGSYVVGSQPTAYDSYEQALQRMKAEQEEAQRKAEEAQRAQIQANKDLIDQNYNSSARQAYIQNMMEKRAIPEYLAAQGQNGGATETALLGLDSNYQNNLKDLMVARNAALANENLADVQLSAQMAQKMADINADYRSQMLAYQKEKEDQARADYLNTMDRFYDNYQQEINNLLASGVPENDYRIQYLKSERQKKIAAQREAQASPSVTPYQQLQSAQWAVKNGIMSVADYNALRASLGI